MPHILAFSSLRANTWTENENVPWLSISLNSPSLNVCFCQIAFLSFKKLSSVNNAESSSKNKMLWTKFSHEEIHEKYVNPLLFDLEFFELDFCDSVSVTENLTSLIVHHSYSLKAPKQPKSDITDSNNRKVYARQPDNVKSGRIRSKSAFDFWKASSFSLGSVSHDNYRSEHRNYCSLLRSLLSKLESDKVKKL